MHNLPNRDTLVVACLSLAACLLTSGQPVQSGGQAHTLPNYVLTDLGPAGATSSRAYGINTTGDVVLQTENRRGRQVPRAWRASTQRITPLEASASLSGYAFAVNDHDQVAGYRMEPDADHACLWDHGKRIDVGPDPRAFSEAYGINNAGDVVGVADMAGYYGRAFLWKHGRMADLGTLSGGGACAYGINDKDEAVGYSLVAYEGADESYEAVLWRDGKVIDLGIHGIAYDINNRGLVVGMSQDNGSVTGGQAKAFSWQVGEAALLPTLGGAESYAYAVNELGGIVGAATTPKGELHAVVWRLHNPLDLNTCVSAPGWKLVEARGINDKGQIAGVGLLRGKQHGFLLTPTANQTQPSADDPDTNATRLPITTDRSNRGEPESLIPRRLAPTNVVMSAPATLDGVACQSIVQAVWPLPEKDPEGNLKYHTDLFQPLLLANHGQSDLFIALRFTNRSGRPLRLRFSEPFLPEMKPFEPANGSPHIGNSRPPNISALMDSPPIAPGQSFTISRPSRLCWEGDHLLLQCFSGHDLSWVRGLKLGDYAYGVEYYNRETFVKSAYKTLIGTVRLNKVTIRIM